MAGRTGRRSGRRGTRAGVVVGGGLVVSVVLAGCGSSGWGGGGGRRRRRQHQRADGEQPADGRPAEADRGQLHQARPASRSTSPCCRRTTSATRSARSSPARPASTTSPRSATSRSRSTRKSNWIAPLDDYIAKDTAFDQDDILKPMTESLTGEDGKLYGEPFYGESSFLMYRKDVLAGRRASRCRPSPTWQQVADIAAKVDGAAARDEGHLPARPARLGPGLRPADHRGEHLRRHLVRQGLDRPRSTRRSSRRPRTSTSTWSARTARTAPRRPGFTECLNNLDPGQRRDVVRRHVGRRLAGGGGLPGQGQDRLRRRAGGQDRRAPAGSTPGPGASRRPARRRTTPGSSSPGPRARSTRSSSASKLGWSKVPAGKRASTYANPDYLKVAVGVRRADQDAIETADPNNPGVQPRPAPGIQFVDIPEFPDLGHPGLAGRQLGDRRPDDASTRPWTRASSSPRTSPSATRHGSSDRRRAGARTARR